MSYDKNLVVKANSLIEARYKFSLWEMRVFTRMVSMIDKDDNQFNLCKIYIKDLIDYFGSTSNNDYDIIKKIPDSLADKKVHIPYEDPDTHEKRWMKLSIFPTVTSPDAKSKMRDGSYIELKFNEDLKPMLLELKRLFKKYDIRNIIPLRSVFSFRIFELLKQYENIGFREIEVQELKIILGIEDKYSLYANFKRKVILQAQKDLEANCDIKFTFEEKKKQRKVHSLVFRIYPNNPPRLLKEQGDKEAIEDATIIEVDEQVNQEVFEKLINQIGEWVEKATLKRWLKKYPEQQVIDGVQYTLNRLKRGEKIPNVGGYLNKMVQQKSLFDPIENKKQKEEVKKEKARAEARKKDDLDAMKKQLQKEKYEQEAKMVENVLQEIPEARETALANLKGGMFARHYDAKKSFEENCENQFFLSAFRSAVKKMYGFRFEALDKNFDPKIKQIERQIRGL